MSKLRYLVLVAGAIIAVLPISTATAGGNGGFGCAPGFDIGAVTFEETLELPRIQAGLADGIYTVDDLEAVFQKIDHNGNALICLKDVGALNDDADGWAYLYSGVDDNSASKR